MYSSLLQALLSDLPDGEVIDVRVGIHWTAVVARAGQQERCGLAATLPPPPGEGGRPDVPAAGRLKGASARGMAEWVAGEDPVLSSLGMAAMNALIPPQPERWVDANAAEVIAQYGAGKKVALVGHFSFVERLRPQVGELMVLEQHPRPGDLPASAASEVIPRADVVAITGMTVFNRTLEELLALRRPGAFVMLLGPSTPLNLILSRWGIHWLSGAVITDIPPVLEVISQGGNFRQVYHAGARLVNIDCRLGGD